MSENHTQDLTQATGATLEPINFSHETMPFALDGSAASFAYRPQKSHPPSGSLCHSGFRNRGRPGCRTTWRRASEIAGARTAEPVRRDFLPQPLQIF
jgi:hypothetical protein